MLILSPQNQTDILFNRFLTNASMLLERVDALSFGKMYGGDRDVPKAAGYNTDRVFDDYHSKYVYQNIAKRIVEAPAESTWQSPPILRDGDLGETPFITTWAKLVNFGRDDTEEITDQKSIWHYCKRVDILAGIGSYAGLVVGIKDGSLSQKEPFRKNATSTISDFLYLAPYDEANITVKEIGNDPYNSRYNLPLSYDQSGNADLADLEVADAELHWTRVIHVAEGLKNNEIFGTSRLEAVYDLLDDLLKVTAATGESAWQLMSKGLIASTRDGVSLPENTDSLRAAMEKFMHEQMRVLQLQGMDVTLTSGQIVDPTGVIKAIVSIMAATTGIPQRILLGSEAGHLASSQDEKNWSQRIMSRQLNFAEALILRPLISRLIFVGLLPKPSSGSYTVHWPSQLLLTDLEKAQLVSSLMAALGAAVSPDKLPLTAFLKIVLEWTDEQVAEVLKAKKLEQAAALIDFPGFGL